MKKTLALLLMLAILILPSQAYAAPPSMKMSISEVNKIYFEDYNKRLKEVKSAIRTYKAPVCSDVTTLTNQSKQLTSKYNNLKKSKASKTELSQMKATLDKAKKSLSEAKKVCNKETAETKKELNGQVKEISLAKTTGVKLNVDSYNKGTITSSTFDKEIRSIVKLVDDVFTYILEDLE